MQQTQAQDISTLAWTQQPIHKYTLYTCKVYTNIHHDSRHQTYTPLRASTHTHSDTHHARTQACTCTRTHTQWHTTHTELYLCTCVHHTKHHLHNTHTCTHKHSHLHTSHTHAHNTHIIRLHVTHPCTVSAHTDAQWHNTLMSYHLLSAINHTVMIYIKTQVRCERD